MIYILALAIIIAVHMYAVYKREKDLEKRGRIKMALSQSIYLFFVAAILVLGYVMKKTGAIDSIQKSVNGYVLYFGMIIVIAIIFFFVVRKKRAYEAVLREAYAMNREEIEARKEAKRKAKRKKELQQKKARREALAREREKQAQKEEIKRRTAERKAAEKAEKERIEKGVEDRENAEKAYTEEEADQADETGNDSEE
jgi:flagellar biosynthesis GTPase FlhF